MCANPIRQKGLTEEVLLLRYKENCDQARQHENLRERTTATIATTVGVLLGVLGLKQNGAPPAGLLATVIAAFIILLGVFGIFASAAFEIRARMHRKRIAGILTKLDTLIEPDEAQTEAEAKRIRFVWIWYGFHGMIVLLGIVLYWFASHSVVAAPPPVPPPPTVTWRFLYNANFWPSFSC